MTMLEIAKGRLIRRVSDLIRETDEQEFFELMTELGNDWPGDLYTSLDHMRYIHCCGECRDLFGECSRMGNDGPHQRCIERFQKEKEMIWKDLDIFGEKMPWT